MNAIIQVIGKFDDYLYLFLPQNRLRLAFLESRDKFWNYLLDIGMVEE
jgi:hypothetical protein